MILKSAYSTGSRIDSKEGHIMTINTNIPSIIDQLFSEGFIDDHRGWFGAKDSSIHTVNAVVIHTRFDEVSVCYATTDSGVRAFSINPFYFNETDGKIHLSTRSNGGVVRFTGYGTLKEAADQYNSEMGYANWPNTFSQLVIITRQDWETKKAKEDDLDRWIKEQEEKKSA